MRQQRAAPIHVTEKERDKRWQRVTPPRSEWVFARASRVSGVLCTIVAIFVRSGVHRKVSPLAKTIGRSRYPISARNSRWCRREFKKIAKKVRRPTSNIQQLDTSLTRPAECCVTWAAFIGRYSQVTSWVALWLVYTSDPRHVNRGQASMAVDAQWLALVKCFCHALDRSGYNRRCAVKRREIVCCS